MPMPRKKNYRKKRSNKLVSLDKYKITKEHKLTGVDKIFPFGTTVSGLVTNQSWYMVDLCHLARNYVSAGGSTGASYSADQTQRESSRIYHKNSTVKFDIIPDPLCLNPLQYRMVLGYFKGDDNVGTSQYTRNDLSAGFPRIYTKLKRGIAGQGDFYFTYISKVHTLSPKMIYDANGSDDQTVGELMKAVWLPKHHELNMRCNKVRNFESDEGDSLDGWRPFFAIQCTPVAGQDGFSAPDIISDSDSTRGSNPTPMLTLDVRTYFQDIH